MLHIPVLLREILQAIEQINGEKREGLDCTFGRGGHSRAFLEAYPDLRLTSIDRDLQAIEFGRQSFAEEIKAQRLRLVHRSFSDFANELKENKFDFVLMDLGVSAPQLDEAGRGFSFYEDGPLDMRMDRSQPITAAKIVNKWAEEDLIELFREIGEVRRPQRVVRAILNDRVANPYTTTLELSEMIARVEGWRIKGKHPATQFFLALRIATNLEYTQIRESIPKLAQHVRPGGRLLVITFHSAEDRIVKYLLKDLVKIGFAVNRKVIIPDVIEEKENPRSRSAKLRVFQIYDHQITDDRSSDSEGADDDDE